MCSILLDDGPGRMAWYGEHMILEADKVDACAADDENLASVWFRDATQDYVFSLSRFIDDQDEGTIEVMVRDQINHPTAELTVVLGNGELHAELTERDAAALDGVRDYTVRFHATAEERRELEAALRAIFRDLDGLTVR